MFIRPWCDWLGASLVGIFALVIGLWCQIAFAETGQASYYTVKSCQSEGTSGVYTASGEKYDEQGLTCARRSRVFGALWLVYGTKTGKSIVVRQNDFGPGKKPYSKGVIIDLTPRAFEIVCGNLLIGKCEVSVQGVK